jgi:chromosome segregation ATPase
MVAAVTPTAQEAQQRDKLLAESDKRISEVQAQIRRTQAIKTHTYDVIEELNKLVKQAEEIRKKLDNINAVPEITQVVIDLQSEIQRQQNFIHTLDQDLDTLSQRRYELLKDREAAMGAFTDRIQKDARRRVAEAQATVVVYPNESKRPSFFFAAK